MAKPLKLRTITDGDCTIVNINVGVGQDAKRKLVDGYHNLSNKFNTWNKAEKTHNTDCQQPQSCDPWKHLLTTNCAHHILYRRKQKIYIYKNNIYILRNLVQSNFNNASNLSQNEY